MERETGTRTRDIDLGKVALYQLSYSRPGAIPIICLRLQRCQRRWSACRAKTWG